MQKAFASVMTVLLLGISSSASCPGPRPRLLCAEYFQSDAVVTAKVLKIRRFTASDGDDYLFYTMQTGQVLRGEMPATFRIIDSPYPSGNSLSPEKGERYLLFLSYSKNDRAWELDGCGNSGLLEKSAETLKGVARLHAGGNGGMVQGNVQLDAGVTVGATVVVRGKRGTFKATTDKEGNFEVHVPGGAYRARVIQEGKSFEPGWSYEDPKRFRVSNGGCAQLQFQEAEQK
jgi:hypothetical protein